MGIPVIQEILLRHIRSAVADEIPSADIPIARVKDIATIRYISAIALKLASVQPRSPVEIAGAIATPEMEKSGIIATVLESGMMQFDLTDAAVADWLHKMTQIPFPETGYSRDSDSLDSPLFPIQYAHARCGSLLRMAHRDRLITLADPDPAIAPKLWKWAEPAAVPWLDEAGKLRSLDRAEMELISQLINTVDICYFPPRKLRWETVGAGLAEGCDRFFRRCPIWGEVKLNDVELSRFRLGLVVVTQSILRFILQEKLGAIAPLEL
ncbi:MAG: arginyl-tRNA synthetase [Limnospira sp.]